MKKDKLYHFIGGMVICFGLSVFIPLIHALYWTIGFGIGKEIVYDWLMKKGTPEVLDAFATGAGGLVVYLVIKGVV